MLILALDTTTRAGSIALVRDDTVIAAEIGDPTRTHGERLPRDILRLLTGEDIPLADVEVYAVAAGPGSFTGLRIGIATLQGLAFAHAKPLIGVSALDALALSAQQQMNVQGTGVIAVWMDAQRQEVFAALYDAADLNCLDGPTVGAPAQIYAGWRRQLERERVWFVGDGAIAYKPIISADGRISDRVAIIEPTPIIAPAVAALAAREIAAGRRSGPEMIRPMYIRRPDAELARGRVSVKAEN